MVLYSSGETMGKVLIKNGKAYVWDEHWVTINGGEPDAYHVLIKENNAEGNSPTKNDADNSPNDDFLRPKELMVMGANGKFVFIKPGNPMTHEDADEGRVNPSKGTDNCVSCVVTYEMRRRGFDVAAGPNNTWQSSRLSKEGPSGAWRTETGKPPHEEHFVGGRDEVVDKINKAINKGERHFLWFSWNGGGGHIITISKDKYGRLILYDAQKNKKSIGTAGLEQLIDKVDVYRKPAGVQGVGLMRVDNLIPNKAWMSGLLVANKKEEQNGT